MKVHISNRCYAAINDNCVRSRCPNSIVGLESLVCDQHKLINPHELDLFEPIYFVFMLNESQRWQHVSSAFSSECDAFIESCIKKGMNARFEKVSLEDINKEFYKKFFPELTK